MCRHVVPRICALTALLLPLALLAGCSRSKSDGAGSGSSAATGAPKDSPGPAGGAGPIKLTVAAIPIVDVAPLYLGKQKGLFSAEGLELEIQNTQGGAQSVPCVVSGAAASRPQALKLTQSSARSARLDRFIVSACPGYRPRVP